MSRRKPGSRRSQPRKRATRPGQGKPPREFSAEQCREVEAMASYGIPHADIAGVIGCAIDTLRKHFRDELETGNTKATARVAKFLFEKATGKYGDEKAAVTAAIFWMKCRGGWQDRQAIELTGKGGGPIEAVVYEIPANGR